MCIEGLVNAIDDTGTGSDDCWDGWERCSHSFHEVKGKVRRVRGKPDVAPNQISCIFLYRCGNSTAR